MYVNNGIKHLSVFCLIGLILVLPRTHSAQETRQVRSKLEGTILDTSKESIPKAEIQLRHIDSGRMFHLKSNKNGKFISDFILPGNYTLTVKKEGYKSYRGELQLRPNLIQKIDIVLAKEETLEQKKEKEAVSSFKKGVKLARENKPDDAIQAFQKAIELKPDFAEAYVNLGILLFQQQKDDEAEKALLKTLELKPEESKSKEILADINYEQAKTLIKENKMDEALEKLKQAYNYREDHAYVNYLLGYLYVNKQMKEEAIKHFEAFLQLKPDAPQFDTVKELLAKLKKENF